MDNLLVKSLEDVLLTLIKLEAKRAMKYLSDKSVVTAMRRTYKGKILKKDNIDIVLKIGKPNYAEREFIKLCKKAKEPFPVKRIQLKYPKK